MDANVRPSREVGVWTSVEREGGEQERETDGTTRNRRKKER